MNWIDLIIVFAVGGGLYTGYRRGALMQLFSWGGFIIGLFAGGAAAVPIVQLLDPATPFARAIIAIAIFLGIAFIVEALLAVVGIRLRKRMKAPWANGVDAALGSVVAGFLALTAAWFLGITLKTGPSPSLASAIRGSAILRFTDRVAPQPPALFAQIGGLLSRTGFPEVFAQLNPSLAPGVDPPPAALADDPQVLAAAELTYKIESRGCGGLVDGSGFPVGNDLVVTAAHVVAGTRDTKILPARERRQYDATVVYIDTRKDIAILRSKTLPDERLRVDPEHAERNTDGAAIGYPGGGPRTISVARVRVRTDAVGRDIYSRRLVEREIYVLRAKVRQGNSGGPFVDTAGRVRGMIFAASSDNPEESYALAEDEINLAISRARARVQPVDTGACAL